MLLLRGFMKSSIYQTLSLICVYVYARLGPFVSVSLFSSFPHCAGSAFDVHTFVYIISVCCCCSGGTMVV